MEAYFARCSEATIPLSSVCFVQINYKTMSFMPTNHLPRVGDVLACVYDFHDRNWDVVDVPSGNIAGYLLVRAIDVQQNLLTVLSPHNNSSSSIAGSQTPSNILVKTGLNKILSRPH